MIAYIGTRGLRRTSSVLSVWSLEIVSAMPVLMCQQYVVVVMTLYTMYFLWQDDNLSAAEKQQRSQMLRMSADTNQASAPAAAAGHTDGHDRLLHHEIASLMVRFLPNLIFLAMIKSRLSDVHCSAGYSCVEHKHNIVFYT